MGDNQAIVGLHRIATGIHQEKASGNWMNMETIFEVSAG
jgi:hypothetical protein